jgi:hypothetical protein
MPPAPPSALSGPPTADDSDEYRSPRLLGPTADTGCDRCAPISDDNNRASSLFIFGRRSRRRRRRGECEFHEYWSVRDGDFWR